MSTRKTPPATAAEPPAEPAPIAEGVTDTETVVADQADRAPLAVLIVTPHADGYRRAGRAWTIEPTRVARDALSEEQIKALQDDPLIDLQVVDAA